MIEAFIIGRNRMRNSLLGRVVRICRVLIKIVSNSSMDAREGSIMRLGLIGKFCGDLLFARFVSVMVNLIIHGIVGMGWKTVVLAKNHVRIFVLLKVKVVYIILSKHGHFWLASTSMRDLVRNKSCLLHSTMHSLGR